MDGVEPQVQVALLVGLVHLASLVTQVHQALAVTRAPVALLVGQVLQEQADGPAQVVSPATQALVDGPVLLVTQVSVVGQALLVIREHQV